MTEVEAYKKVYGDLVYCVPHYRKRISDPNKKVDAGHLNYLFNEIKNDMDIFMLSPSPTNIVITKQYKEEKQNENN